MISEYIVFPPIVLSAKASPSSQCPLLHGDQHLNDNNPRGQYFPLGVSPCTSAQACLIEDLNTGEKAYYYPVL